MASKQRRNSTIYENSTLMAVSFLRTSSLALADMTLGRGGRPPERVGPVPELLPTAYPVVQGARRLSVEPERHTTTYLMADPNTATATATVDESATEYIRRVREKIRKESITPNPRLL